MVLTTAESRAKVWPVKLILTPWRLRLLSVLSSGSVVVYSLYIVAPIVFWGFVLGLCFVVQRFMSFSSFAICLCNCLTAEVGAGKWFLCFYCLLCAVWLMFFFAPSSWCCELV